MWDLEVDYLLFIDKLNDGECSWNIIWVFSNSLFIIFIYSENFAWVQYTSNPLLKIINIGAGAQVSVLQKDP
jgi:hypothetical protein